jgi:hypothetical protein
MVTSVSSKTWAVNYNIWPVSTDALFDIDDASTRFSRELKLGQNFASTTDFNLLPVCLVVPIGNVGIKCH